MTFYRVRETIGTPMQAKYFKPFDTLEEAMAETETNLIGTLAYVFEFDEPPHDDMLIDFKKTCCATWRSNLGWITPDHPLWASATEWK